MPERKGALQVEMIAAARSFARLAVELEPSIAAIVDELNAGRPVVVLQNLGVGWLPVWHYAVVVGYDGLTASLVLRSGDERRRIMKLGNFDRTWRRSGRWAMVVLRPGELPATASPARYLESVVALESSGSVDAAALAYDTGLQRWPGEKLLLLGRANTAYRRGDMPGAVDFYRQALKLHPAYLPVVNNLAHTLMELDCRDEALAVLDTARSVDAAALAEMRVRLAARPHGECRLPR